MDSVTFSLSLVSQCKLKALSNCRQFLIGESASARAGILVNLPGIACSRDNNRDVRMGEAEAQSRFGEGTSGIGDFFDPFGHIQFPKEVLPGIPLIPFFADAVGELGIAVKFPAQDSLVERPANEGADTIFAAVGEDVLFRCRMGQAVIQLAGGAIAVSVEAPENFRVVSRNAISPDKALFFQFLESFEEDIRFLKIADVALVEVDVIGAQPVEAGVAAGNDVEGIRKGEGHPEASAPVADFGGDNDLVAFAGKGFSEALLACAHFDAIGIGGVEEGNPLVEGGLHNGKSFVFRDGAELPAESPAAEANAGYVPIRIRVNDGFHAEVVTKSARSAQEWLSSTVLFHDPSFLALGGTAKHIS